MKKTRGTVGIDHLVGNARANFLLGLDGDDVMEGRGGSDILKGGTGYDYIYGGSGRDRIYGEADDDYLFGDGGNDTIWGGSGNDIIVGGRGDDKLFGGIGNDQLFSISGDDIMKGGAGNDTYHIALGLVTARDISGNDEYIVLPDSRATIMDTGGTDKLRFRDNDSTTTIEVADMLFQRFGDDLVISVDGYGGETTLSLFFSSDKTHRIERIYDEKRALSGYDMQIDALFELTNGGSASGADLWAL
jgi:Ca2+-binding RTX toxin-like protein